MAMERRQRRGSLEERVHALETAGAVQAATQVGAQATQAAANAGMAAAVIAGAAGLVVGIEFDCGAGVCAAERDPAGPAKTAQVVGPRRSSDVIEDQVDATAVRDLRNTGGDVVARMVDQILDSEPRGLLKLFDRRCRLRGHQRPGRVGPP